MSRTPIPPKVRWQVLARDGFRCRYCGATGGDAVLVVDHAQPVAHGGTDAIHNLITACEECNQGKGVARLYQRSSPGWQILADLVPELGDLAGAILAVRGGAGFCANRAWYERGGFRSHLGRLVGWGARHDDPWVRSREAYDLAYHTLYRILPDCDHEPSFFCVPAPSGDRGV